MDPKTIEEEVLREKHWIGQLVLRIRHLEERVAELERKTGKQ